MDSTAKGETWEAGASTAGGPHRQSLSPTGDPRAPSCHRQSPQTHLGDVDVGARVSDVGVGRLQHHGINLDP